MTIKEKLAAIYKEIANKEKTMWCKYLVYAKNKPDEIMEAIEEWVNFTLFFGENDYAMSPSEVDYYEYYSIKEIIWHPVMIGDVLDRYRTNNNFIFVLKFMDLIEHYKKIAEYGKLISNDYKKLQKCKTNLDRALMLLEIEQHKHRLHCLCVECWVADYSEHRYWEKIRVIDGFHERLVTFDEPKI